MDVLEAIRTRRSARSFSDRPIEPHVLDAILETVLHSPSASHAQEAHFVVVREPARIRSIKRFAQGLSGFPPALVVLCSNETEARIRGGIDNAETVRLINLGVAAAHIMLAAQSLGVASCPVRSFHQPSIAEIVGLPADVKPELIITLGYADQPPLPKQSKPKSEMISYEQYGRGPN